MEKSEMSEQQLRQRSMFVDSLTAAGWRGLNFNEKFEHGLWVSPEASMEYSNATMALRLDQHFQDPRVILYLDSPDGKSLGLVFKCSDRLKPLLDAVIEMQDTLSPASIKEKSEQLLAACPQMFKISASGDQLIPVKPRKSR
jgi:hypothetical protein